MDLRIIINFNWTHQLTVIPMLKEILIKRTIYMAGHEADKTFEWFLNDPLFTLEGSERTGSENSEQ